MFINQSSSLDRFMDMLALELAVKELEIIICLGTILGQDNYLYYIKIIIRAWQRSC